MEQGWKMLVIFHAKWRGSRRFISVVSPPCVFTVFHEHSYSTLMRSCYFLQTLEPKISAPATNSVHSIPGSVPGVGRWEYKYIQAEFLMIKPRPGSLNLR